MNSTGERKSDASDMSAAAGEPESFRQISLLDDHPAISNGVAAWLREHLLQVEIEIFQNIRSLQESYLGGRVPQLQIVDISLQGESGLDALRWIKANYPSVRVMVYTLYSNMLHVKEAKKSGADGYLLKSDPMSYLLAAVQQLQAGESYFSRNLAGNDMPLSPFQIEILKVLMSGCTQDEVAERLDKSRKTIEYHLKQMRAKLGARSNVEMITRYQALIGS